nr:hypothetical protein [uncultured Cohaesibacter sp.]
MNWITTYFSNREIALAIWGGIVVLAMAVGFRKNTGIRGALISVVKAMLAKRLVLLFCSYALWIVGVVLVLNRTGLWTLFELKDTMLWTIFSGLALLGGAIRHERGAAFFWDIVKDQFTVLAAFEFIVVAYSFALWAELILLPIVASISILHAMAGTKEEWAPAERVCEWVLSLFFLLITWHFIATSIETKGELFSSQTLRTVLLPILLSTLSLPAFYLGHCYAKWESLAIRLEIGNPKSDHLKAAAKKIFFLPFFLRPQLLERAVRQFKEVAIESLDDICTIVTELKFYELQRKNPPPIAKQDGWSPYAAELFLTNFDLRTNDYHRTCVPELWLAESQNKSIDNTFPRKYLAYRIKGTSDVVKVCKLEGHFQLDPSPVEAMELFIAAAEELAATAAELGDLPAEIANALAAHKNCLVQVDEYRLSVRFYKFSDANIFDVSLTVSVADAEQFTI